MKRLNTSLLDKYLAEDRILKFLDHTSLPQYEALTCQQWLRNTPPKRYIYEDMYGDLIRGECRKVLDIGGGLTAFTSHFCQQHDYTLIELMAHDAKDVSEFVLDSISNLNLFMGDWYDFEVEKDYDFVIANDLLPNVDQRLELFLDKFLPHTREIRLSLTFYNDNRFYLTKRIDADELLCVKPWDGQQLLSTLLKYEARIINKDMTLLDIETKSLFPNGRQVILVNFKGDKVSLF